MIKHRKPTDNGVTRMVGNEPIGRAVLLYRIACVIAGQGGCAVPHLPAARERLEELLKERFLRENKEPRTREIFSTVT